MPGTRLTRHKGPGRAEARLRAEQPAQPRGSSLRLWLVRVPALLLIFGSLYILHELFRAARFTVSAVAVEGTRLLPKEQVVAALGVEGASLFWVNPVRLAAYLESTYPIVDEAVVQCELPDKVIVQVQERRNLLQWESGGSMWWVDHQGNVLGAVASPLGMVVVHDVDGVAPQPTGRITGVPWGLVGELVEAMPTMSRLDYTRDKGLVVYATSKGWPVYLGHEGDGAAKVAIMLALTQQLEAREEVEYIDLRNERRPVFQRQ